MDITNLMNDYRECARNIWNAFLLGKNISTDIWDKIEQFDKVCSILFNIMVLTPINYNSYQKALIGERYPEPLSFLRVSPISQTSVPIMVNREKKVSGYWDYPFNLTDKADIELRFIDFFDFDVQSFRDFEYYRVRVVDSSQDPAIIGRDALIKNNYATVEAL